MGLSVLAEVKRRTRSILPGREKSNGRKRLPAVISLFTEHYNVLFLAAQHLGGFGIIEGARGSASLLENSEKMKMASSVQFAMSELGRVAFLKYLPVFCT